jgi:hypothetical protein
MSSSSQAKLLQITNQGIKLRLIHGPVIVFYVDHPLTSLTNEQIVAEIKYTEAYIYKTIGGTLI